MALDEYQQTYTLIGKSKNALIITGKRELDDTYPSGIALKTILNKARKESTLFTPWVVPDRFDFLQDNSKNIAKNKIGAVRGLIISIDTTSKPIKQLSYDRSNGGLSIYVYSQDSTQLQEQDVHISMSKFNYDLILTIGLADLSCLGEYFEHNAQLFYETPIINIDYSASNERYGEINLIETTSSSCSEIIAQLIKKWDETLLAKSSTTALLTGIIASTNNFQNNRTSPSTLYEAAYLMSHEADQQEIIKQLFKTKPFEIIKLCGIAMSKLQYNKKAKLGWTSLDKKDFFEAGTNTGSVPFVISELQNGFPQTNSLIVFYEQNNSSTGIVCLPPTSRESNKILEHLKGVKEGDNIVFTINSKDTRERQKTVGAVSRIMYESDLS